MNDLPLHLLLPLLASFLFVSGLLFIKRATSSGVSPWTVTFLANQWAALVFSTLWFLGGEVPSISQLWQPAVIASLYILGQVFTFSAIRYGDVSVATPVFGIKVVLVAILVVVLFQANLSTAIWLGAVLATLGIGLVQWTPREAGASVAKKQLLMTVCLALLAAAAFATFDVLVQHWAPSWGAGRFLPITYWIVSVLSLGFLPWVQRNALTDPIIRLGLAIGTLLVALQAICIVFTLATFQDPTRVNVVYAMRGMWGVILAYLVAKRWGGNEATLPKNVLVARFAGATLLTGAVVMVVLLERRG